MVLSSLHHHTQMISSLLLGFNEQVDESPDQDGNEVLRRYPTQ
jgi:hypothetical protein